MWYLQIWPLVAEGNTTMLFDVVNSFETPAPRSWPHNTSIRRRIQRRHLLNDLRRRSHRHTPSRYAPAHHRTRCDRAALPNLHTRQHHHMPPNPAVIPNHHRLPVLNIVPATLHLDLVRSPENRHVRPKHDPIPN